MTSKKTPAKRPPISQTRPTGKRSKPGKSASASKTNPQKKTRKKNRGSLTSAQISTIMERLKTQNPEPTTELCYDSPFQLLVAVILSAQATDVSVNKATKTLFGVAPTAPEIVALGESALKKHIKAIGLFNTKAANVIRTCALLIERHGGHVPADRQSLERLPGVGRKTANVILNTAFGQPTIAVDTHIFRVANRTGMACATAPLGVELQLLKAIPDTYLHNAHHWLILLGRYVCIARKPLCSKCIISDLCRFEEKTGLSS